MKQISKQIVGASLAILMSPVMALANPRIEDVFSSIKEQTRGQSAEPNRIAALMIALIALALAYVAAKHWNHRSAKPKPLNNQKKLLKEVCRKTGVPRGQLKQISDLTESQGLTSPLVAMICPSVLRKLAASARTDQQRRALADVARTLVENERS